MPSRATEPANQSPQNRSRRQNVWEFQWPWCSSSSGPKLMMLELAVEEMKTCSNGTRFLDNTQLHVVRTGIEMDKMSKTELFGQAGMKNRKILHLAQKCDANTLETKSSCSVKIVGDAQLHWDSSRTKSTTPFVPNWWRWSRTLRKRKMTKCVEIPSNALFISMWSKLTLSELHDCVKPESNERNSSPCGPNCPCWSWTLRK